MISPFRKVSLSAVLTGLGIGLSLAGEPSGSAPAPMTGEAGSAAERPPGWLAFTPGYTHQFDTDLDGGDISFSADRWRLVTGTRIPFSDAFTLTIGLETEWSRYDFSGVDAQALGLTKDTDDLFVGQIGAMGTYAFNDTWELMVGGTASWGGDFDASFSDGAGGSGLLGVTYRFTPRFSLTPGVLALARLEDDALVIPVLGMDWEINDAWRLRSIGPGAELSWRAHENWSFLLRALYRPRDYRLASDATVPNGVLRERAIPVSATIQWQPTQRVTASIFGGAILGGQLRLVEDGGRERLDEDADITPIVGGSLRIMF